MAEYRHGSHSVFEIHLHLVWVTKYRKPVLAGAVGVRVRDLIREICGSCDVLILVYAIVYNLVRLVMLEAAHRQGVDVERISFVDALRWLGEARPGDPLPRLVVNPFRPGRFEPRVRKRRPKQYPVMQKPRSELRKLLLEQSVSA